MGSLFDRPAVLIVLLIGIVLIFGSKRLPDAARGLGRSLRIFKAETRGLLTDDDGKPTDQQQPGAQQAVPPVPAPPQVQAAPDAQPAVAPAVSPPVSPPVQPTMQPAVEPAPQAPVAPAPQAESEPRA